MLAILFITAGIVILIACIVSQRKKRRKFLEKEKQDNLEKELLDHLENCSNLKLELIGYYDEMAYRNDIYSIYVNKLFYDNHILVYKWGHRPGSAYCRDIIDSFTVSKHFISKIEAAYQKSPDSKITKIRQEKPPEPEKKIGSTTVITTYYRFKPRKGIIDRINDVFTDFFGA